MTSVILCPGVGGTLRDVHHCFHGYKVGARGQDVGERVDFGAEWRVRKESDCSRCKGRCLKGHFRFPPQFLWFLLPLVRPVHLFCALSIQRCLALYWTRSSFYKFVFIYQIGTPFIQRALQSPQGPNLQKEARVYGCGSNSR